MQHNKVTLIRDNLEYLSAIIDTSDSVIDVMNRLNIPVRKETDNILQYLISVTSKKSYNNSVLNYRAKRDFKYFSISGEKSVMQFLIEHEYPANKTSRYSNCLFDAGVISLSDLRAHLETHSDAQVYGISNSAVAELRNLLDNYESVEYIEIELYEVYVTKVKVKAGSRKSAKEQLEEKYKKGTVVTQKSSPFNHYMK